MSNAKKGPTLPLGTRGNYDNNRSYDKHLSPRNLAVPGTGLRVGKQPSVPVNPFGDNL